MSKRKGKIFYFDGPDGSGKSTQLKMVATALRDQGHDVHVTRTLGGTHIGEMLREVMLSETDRPVETDLYIALACQYALAEDIIERANDGEIVLVDRSPLSIIAYQVFADGIKFDVAQHAVDELLDLIRPDLIIIYTANDKELERRRKVRNHDNGNDYFEVKPLAYHRKVVKGYASAAVQYKADVIDANDDLDRVCAATMKLVKPVVDQTT